MKIFLFNRNNYNTNTIKSFFFLVYLPPLLSLSKFAIPLFHSYCCPPSSSSPSYLSPTLEEIVAMLKRHFGDGCGQIWLLERRSGRDALGVVKKPEWTNPDLSPIGIYVKKAKAQSGMHNGQDVGNVTSFGPSRALPDNASLFEKGLAQKVSPPWQDDDKDGHYMFALGENLTSRYKIY
ncbi:Uncharacterized protein TCM_010612 [Theobroma cacao]|uniref:Uncharacterized protein n=1 Tax=Theobroma cacao TaxID=3641 RepID=A0A061E8N2_THECC|nr:Uncharacterized protein TCM_010612 [Theobroma cacao]